MSAVHLRSRSGPDGKVHLGDVSVGVADADVDITVSVVDKIGDDQWRREMREILDSMGDIHVETYPRTPMKDPWSEE